VIAAMLLAMSVDEIACLHERIEGWRTGPILSFVPFLLVLLGGCAWSFVQLWLTPSERTKVLGLVLGFGLLVSVGGQEIVERIVQLPWYMRPFRFAFEEGSELTGMLIIIYNVMPNSAGLFDSARPARHPAFSGVAALRWPIVVAAILVAWPLAELTASLGDQSALGHFSDWLSCALFFFAAALLMRRWACSVTRESFPASAVVLLCAASAICVQFDPIGDLSVFPGSSTIDAFGVELNTRLVLLALCCLGTGTSLRRRGAGYHTCAVSLLAIGAGSAILSAFTLLLWSAYLATTAIGIGTFGAVGLMLGVPTVQTRAVERTLT
jgi:hypothetical protein